MATRTQSTRRNMALSGLIVGALGIVILRLAGVDMPVVPPGLVLLLAAAIALATARGRWAAILTAVVGFVEIGGFLASGSYTGLFETGSPLVTAGTWIRLAGIVTATIAGLMASVENRRTVNATGSDSMAGS